MFKRGENNCMEYARVLVSWLINWFGNIYEYHNFVVIKLIKDLK